MTLSLGLDTFGDVTLDAQGTPLPQDQVLRDLVEEGVLADSLGVDFLGVGEHHRDDFAVSAPRSCWPPSPQGPAASGWVRRSRCCPRTIRCGCSSGSRP